jgi:hypothetical protein
MTHRSNNICVSTACLCCGSGRCGYLERHEGDDVLDLAKVDLGTLAEAWDDHSHYHSWWLDPKTGEAVPWSEFEELDEPDPETQGLIAIPSISSHEAYADMQDFIQRVRDPRARDVLTRAIEGRGASVVSGTRCWISRSSARPGSVSVTAR